MIGLAPIEDPTELPATRRGGCSRAGTPLVAMSGPPLMHGTGCWLGMMVPAPVRRHRRAAQEGRGLDPPSVWDAVEREGVQHLIVVGDAFAKPLLRALDEQPDRWDLSSLRLMISSGAMFSAEVKHGLIDHMPALAIADVLGADRGRHGHVDHDARTRHGPRRRKFSLNATTQGLHRRRPRGRPRAPARSAWWPTAAWCRSGTTRIPRSRRARSGR